MKKEEKELLLIDLSVRIPYGVICHTYIGNFKLLGIDDEVLVHLDSPGGYFYLEHNITPYLRPMSSMTDEEKKVYKELIDILPRLKPVGFLTISLTGIRRTPFGRGLVGLTSTC